MSATQSTLSSDDLLVSVEVLGSVHDRSDGADPLGAAAGDIAWDIAWPNVATDAPHRV
ncbi:hypothetical protein ACFVT1_06155 [Streptomyces sp. NPDC057963]|uniref:hypothetical protein n=1 Tax=Streptomyces sp. NPDC057963 TaxID=3346290 RepID=UPI0036F0F36A